MQKFTVKFVEVGDVMSKIGGYVAAMMPALQVASPLLLLSFLYKLSQIMRYLSVKKFFNASAEFLNNFKTQVEKIIKLDKLKPEFVAVI